MDIVQTAVVLSFGLVLASKLDELISERPDFKNGMVSTIINFPNAKCSDIVKKSNEIFLQLFNLLYTNKSKNEFLWSWIYSSFITLLLYGLFIQKYQIIISFENLLILYIMLSSTVFIFSIFTYLFIDKIKSNFKIKRMYTFMIMLLLLVIFGAAYGIILINIFYLMDDSFEKSTLYSMIFMMMFGFLIGLTFINYLSNRKTVLLDKSPIRVIITSFLAIIFITLLKKDILTAFIFDYNEVGIILLAYLFLNVFADSISLLETDIVLRLAAKGNIKRFAALGLFDIFLSAVIFLAIPLSTGNLDVFLDAMLFKGDHPWLGVLFWSTFSTSIIFWLFLLSVFVLTILQKVSKYYVKLNVALPIDKKPITCLYVTAVFIMLLTSVII